MVRWLDIEEKRTSFHQLSLGEVTMTHKCFRPDIVQAHTSKDIRPEPKLTRLDQLSWCHLYYKKFTLQPWRRKYKQYYLVQPN